jgi:hypothetical protein
MELLKSISSEVLMEEHFPAYLLSSLKKEYPDLQFLSDDVIVIFKNNENIWMDYCFLEWSAASEHETYFTPFWHGSGTLGSLKEARHSHIGENGYVFYIKKDNFIKALDWLSKHFDLD